jgi:hypothetical protein
VHKKPDYVEFVFKSLDQASKTFALNERMEEFLETIRKIMLERPYAYN